MIDLILQNFRMHVALSEQEAAVVTSSFQHRKVRKNQLLVEPPYPANTEHFIISGCLRIYYLDSDGVEHNIAFGVEGWWLTDLQSFFTGNASKYHVEALEDSEVFIITKERWEDLLIQIPSLNIYFRKLYQNSIIAQNDRLLNMISTKADERYLRFIKKYPTLENRLPQYHIASYLGVTPVFLSKIKARLSSKH